MLERLVLELDGALEPVFAVQVHHDAALVKAMVALREIRLDHEAEVFLPGLHLQHRCIVVPEMVVSPLPEVGMRGGGDGNGVALDLTGCRLPGPLEQVQVHFSAAGERFGHAIGEGRISCLLRGLGARNGTDAASEAKDLDKVSHSVDTSYDLRTRIYSFFPTKQKSC